NRGVIQVDLVPEAAQQLPTMASGGSQGLVPRWVGRRHRMPA
ncbi:hypothetical protein L917_16916, partial [Phytophthora nicotianae]